MVGVGGRCQGVYVSAVAAWWWWCCWWWTHDDAALRACLVACSLPVRRESDRVDFALPFTHDDGFFYLVVDFGWPAVIDDDDDGVVRDDAWALCDGRMCSM